MFPLNDHSWISDPPPFTRPITRVTSILGGSFPCLVSDRRVDSDITADRNIVLMSP